LSDAQSLWESLGLDKATTGIREREARQLVRARKWEQAIPAYRELLAQEDESAEYRFQLGRCYVELRRWADAARELERAATLGDARAEALLPRVRRSIPVRSAELRPMLKARPSAQDGAPAEDDSSPAVVVGGEVVTRAGPDEPPPPPTLYLAESAPPYAAPEGASAKETAAKPIVCPPVADVFASGGPLAQLLGPRYRAREGQAQMAQRVRAVLEHRRHGVIEAGTGIGKSFAYLIPVLWAGTSAVVSTSNKGLMNQLWEKDIPMLREIAPRPFKAALLKGRSNYVCAMRLDALQKQPGLPHLDETLGALREALNRVPSGDMGRMHLPPELVARLTVGSRECRGTQCDHYKTCYYERAKRKAVEADLVVTNHAMLCTNTLLTENRILPIRPVLIIDEAHQLPHYAVEALTLALERDQFWGLMNGPIVRQAASDEESLIEIRENYEAFFREVARQRPDAQAARWAIQGELQAGLGLSETLRRLSRAIAHSKAGDEADREMAALQSEELATVAQALAEPEPDTHIRLCALGERAASRAVDGYDLSYRPLEVGDPLQRFLFDEWPRVICTSATLSVSDDLGWFRRKVGLFETEDDAPVITATIPGPFDYREQMLIYTPRNLTPVYNPKQQAFTQTYVDDLTGEVRRLLEASRGRALMLCTSRRRMQQLYDTLAPALQDRYPCYVQGAMSQPALVSRFKRDGNAILFATRGFWEGLDIPGEALAMVILDKIPFVPFNDPVIRKREAQIKARGGNPFFEIQLGSAILNLRQGSGRLIRSETDRGVIALLDGRLLQKRYGRQILRSLPPGTHTTEFEQVAAFLRKR
jgi:ATP-dependent DNA helicase DinG